MTSNDTSIKRQIKKAKERAHRTILYSHECPYCGDPCDDYDVSLVGAEPTECVCGETYEVVKERAISNEQRRTARLLNIHPAHIDEHLDTIDSLLAIEKHQGRQEMLKEIAKMLGAL